MCPFYVTVTPNVINLLSFMGLSYMQSMIANVILCGVTVFNMGPVILCAITKVNYRNLTILPPILHKSDP